MLTVKRNQIAKTWLGYVLWVEWNRDAWIIRKELIVEQPQCTVGPKGAKVPRENSIGPMGQAHQGENAGIAPHRSQYTEKYNFIIGLKCIPSNNFNLGLL